MITCFLWSLSLWWRRFPPLHCICSSISLAFHQIKTNFRGVFTRNRHVYKIHVDLLHDSGSSHLSHLPVLFVQCITSSSLNETNNPLSCRKTPQRLLNLCLMDNINNRTGNFINISGKCPFFIDEMKYNITLSCASGIYVCNYLIKNFVAFEVHP